MVSPSGITSVEAMLFCWHKQYGEALSRPAPASTPIGFTPVAVAGPKPAAPPTPAAPSTALIELDFPSGNRLRISGACDPELVAAPQIKIQKPDRQTFIRVHPDPTYRVDVPVVIFKEEGEFYLVRSRQAKEALSGETCVIALFLCVTLQGTPFLWPIPKQRADDLKWNPWHESAYDGDRKLGAGSLK